MQSSSEDAPSAILARLKRETQAEHAAIELRVDLPRRTRSAGEYGRLLARFWGFYAPIEERLAARPEWKRYGIDLRPRLKAPALARDLRALGWPADTLAALPRCRDLPAIDSFPRALGCLYVLEGATLGGQLIAREARQALGLSAERGCAFFLSYGENVGRMWRAFRALLTQAAAAEADDAEIVCGARATFAAFDRWLAQEEER